MTTIPWRAAIVGTLLTLAQPAAAAEGGVATPPAAARAENGTEGTAGAERDEPGGDTDGGDVVGVALMVIGAGAVGVGATILVIDAAGEDAERDEAGADPGLEGVRGRSAQETTDDSGAVPAIGLGLVVGGAVVHLIGVVIAFGSHDDEDAAAPPPAARVEPLVGPGFGGLRGTF